MKSYEFENYTNLRIERPNSVQRGREVEKILVRNPIKFETVRLDFSSTIEVLEMLDITEQIKNEEQLHIVSI